MGECLEPEVEPMAHLQYYFGDWNSFVQTLYSHDAQEIRDLEFNGCGMNQNSRCGAKR